MYHRCIIGPTPLMQDNCAMTPGRVDMMWLFEVARKRECMRCSRVVPGVAVLLAS